jgi:hypothetical protein
MCFSAKVSLLTFIIGMLTSILNYNNNDDNNRNKIISLFFGFISSMQLIEYFLWTHQYCDNTNRMLSKLGLILNHLQPIVLGLLFLSYYKDIINTNNKNNIIITMLLYSLIIIPYSLQYTKKYQCTIKNESTHLDWKWNKLNYYVIIYLIFLLTMSLICFFAAPNYYEKIIYILCIILSFSLSVIFYSKAVGALWCYFTVFMPLIYYFISSHFLQ